MQQELAAKRLAELGHSTRLGIFRHLVRGAPGGCPVGDVQRTLGIPGSTLTHHIARLVSAGLVEQHRDGRILYCIPQAGCPQRNGGIPDRRVLSGQLYSLK